MADSTLHRYFAWLERHLQRLQVLRPLRPAALARAGARAARGAARAIRRRSSSCARRSTSRATTPRTDIHQHPGGVWSDPIAGFVYERGARSTTPLAGRAPRRPARPSDATWRWRTPGAGARMLDLGCGFGKSTRPFYRARCRRPRSTAIDLSAPCLQARRADGGDAGARTCASARSTPSRTGLSPTASFDLVTSTMLLHEMPPPVIERTSRRRRAC